MSRERERSTPHARFTARAADLRSASRRRWALLVGAGVVAVLLVWVVAFSPLLAVRSVDVSGADRGLSDRVRVQADSAVGRPLVRADSEAVRRSVERIPEVRSVEVSRALPSTLRVQVRPRTPVVVVDGGEGRRLVDADGVAYAAASGQAADRLPVVRLSGDRASGRDIAAVATVMGAVPATLRDRVEDVRLDRIGHVSFRVGGLTVRWGSSARSAAKADALTTMRPIAEKEGSRALDVTSPKRPVLS